MKKKGLRIGMYMDIEFKETTVYDIENLKALQDVAKTILDTFSGKVFLFYGDLGAGKTSLIKEMCLNLGITALVNSPTYALVNEYKEGEMRIYHMDLYRLKSTEEAFDMGIEEYLYSDAYCFIEWPQVIENIIDVPHHVINIVELDNESRQLKIK